MPKQKTKQKRKRRKFPIIILITLLIVGIGIILYPLISNIWNTHIQNQIISNYNEVVTEVQENDSERYEEEWEKAFKYNDGLWPTPYPENFAFLNDDDPTPEYMECLNINGDGMMGYVRIPKIGVTIPIYHTNEEIDVLSLGAEHLEGTSLPIGGENTHCVISAHRGVPGSALFTDLNELDFGDHFSLIVLGEELYYEVDQILTVEPDDVSNLVIEEGQDYCTLLTCTPYGINTERLLVRGHRVELEDEEVKLVNEENMGLTEGRNLYNLLAVIMSIAMTAVIFLILFAPQKRKQQYDFIQRVEVNEDLAKKLR